MLVLVGKTCSGKNTIRDILVDEYDMDPVISYTTRPPRAGEENYVDYIFVSKNHFRILKEEGWFAETTAYTVANNDVYYYASTLSDYEDGDNKVIILNPAGLKAVRKLGIPIFAVMIDAPNKCLKERLMLRDDDEKEATRRLRADNVDFKGLDVDGIFTNVGDVKKTAEAIYNAYQYYLAKVDL